MQSYTTRIISSISGKHEPEFEAAVTEVLESISDEIKNHPEFEKQALLERLTQPERIIQFRVPWLDDLGKVQVNTGYRVQFNSALGPYKGGLRFHPSVNLSILKFLAFEQIFKNSLTGLPLGGGKGGSDFDPKGKSDNEIMKFCQSFMSELYRHIGSNTDVPAGDIGVGAREIGYLFGQYKKLKNEYTGTLTGKSVGWGGSLIRTEATGFGAIYFLLHLLQEHNLSITKEAVGISGSGNVALHAAQKILELGGTVKTLSDSKGTLYFEQGLSEKELAIIKIEKNDGKRLSDIADQTRGMYYEGQKPWSLSGYTIALPSATQNEISLDDAKHIEANSVKIIAEAANMPTHFEAVSYIQEETDIILAPGKAVNAGGVAVSGLEMSQNAQHIFWTAEEVDSKLQTIMHSIYNTCKKYGTNEEGVIDYIKGANIGGFKRVAQAMLDQGVV